MTTATPNDQGEILARTIVVSVERGLPEGANSMDHKHRYHERASLWYHSNITPRLSEELELAVTIRPDEAVQRRNHERP